MKKWYQKLRTKIGIKIIFLLLWIGGMTLKDYEDECRKMGLDPYPNG